MENSDREKQGTAKAKPDVSELESEILSLEVKRLRLETQMLEQLQMDVASGVETKRTIGAFLIGVTVSLLSILIVFHFT